MAIFGGTAAIAVAAALTTSMVLAPGHLLHSPFPQAGTRPAAPPPEASCPPPPPAIRDIQTVSKYGSNGRENDSSVIDPADAAKFGADTRPILDFTHQVSRFADGLSERRRSAFRDARCALEWMDGWAARDALLGTMNPTGEAVRKWELATLATAYLKIRDTPLDGAADRRVRRWLQRLGAAVRADYSRGPDRESRQNNHLYWAAWAAMAAGIATDDRGLFDWAVGRLHFALAQIQPDGTLPLELRRRQLALSYHAFALGPLVMLREGALHNGVALSPAEERRLQALVDRVISGLADPAYFAAKAGYPQDMAKVTDTQLAWLEPWYARSRDARIWPLLAARRPVSASRLGGELTALYAPGLYAASAPRPHPRPQAE